MLRCLPLLILWLMPWPDALHAQVPDCADLPEQASEIHALRDENAELGVARAEDLLERLHASGKRCPDGELQLLHALAANLHILGRHHEGLIHMQRALELMEGAPDTPPERRARIQLTIGLLHWELEAYDQAVAHYLESMRASEEAGDVIAAGQAAGNIGNLYNTTADYQRARDYHELALARFEEAEWPIGIAGTLVNLAALTGQLARDAERMDAQDVAEEEYGRMLEIGRRALARFEELDNRRGVAHATNNIAAALSGLGRPEEALAYHERALGLHREVGDRSGEVQSMMDMAATFRAMNDLEAADDWLVQAAERLPEDNLARARDIAEQRVDLAERRGDYRSALEHQKLVTTLRRAIADGEMTARVEAVRLSMEAEQRERELALLRSEAELAELRLARQRATTIVTTLIALVLLLLLALVFGLYRARIKRSRQLEEVARTDALTGLSNRRDMMERLAAAHRDDTRNCCLILADLDDFKVINDHHGHGVGDEVLQQLGQRLVGAIKVRDVVGRWGGEEFIILLPDTDIDDAHTVAEHLRTAVSETPFATSVGEFSLTLTMGVTDLSAASSVDQAVRRADEAMYRGKAAGKNRSVRHMVA
jgi:diguanylate cyclase (GGDEF)-like protein